MVQLEDYPVDQILSSPTVRCHQTVQPLADDRLLPIEDDPGLNVDAGPAQVLGVLGNRRLHNVVLCTHGETIAQLFAQLATDGLAVDAPLRWPKGSSWLLQRTRNQVQARYLSPLSLDPLLSADRPEAPSGGAWSGYGLAGAASAGSGRRGRGQGEW